MIGRRLPPALLGLLLGLAAEGMGQVPPGPLQDLPASFVTLGTGGGPLIRAERSQPANAVVVGDAVYLFDTGDGVQRQMVLAHMPLGKVRAVFLSHLHIDHTAGLGPLLLSQWMFREDHALPVIGPPGTAAMVAGLAAANHGAEVAPVSQGYTKPPTAGAARARDLPPEMDTPQVVYQDEKVRVLAITNAHYHYAAGGESERLARSYAFRIETAKRSVVFTGDSGPSPHLELLARGTDVLVSEVIDLVSIERSLRARSDNAGPIAGLMRHMREDHMTPGEAGKLAAAARVGELVLTHVVPGSDGETDLSGYTWGIAETYHGPVHLARDLDRW